MYLNICQTYYDIIKNRKQKKSRSIENRVLACGGYTIFERNSISF